MTRVISKDSWKFLCWWWLISPPSYYSDSETIIMYCSGGFRYEWWACAQGSTFSGQHGVHVQKNPKKPSNKQKQIRMVTFVWSVFCHSFAYQINDIVSLCGSVNLSEWHPDSSSWVRQVTSWSPTQKYVMRGGGWVVGWPQFSWGSPR